MNIVFLDTITFGDEIDFKPISNLGDVKMYSHTLPEERLVRCKEAEIIITNKVLIDKELLQQLDKLRLVCIAATGTNNVDLEFAKSKGIVVKNAEDYSSNSVAQTTIQMALHLMHRPWHYDAYVKNGDYAESNSFCHIAHNFSEIAGKKYGIIGLGNIGRKVATIVEAFGAKVFYYSASGKNTDQPYTRLDLDELMQTCDIISIHAPLNEHTKNLIAWKQLKQMQSHALLVNVGRGGIVVESDLAKAIDEGLLAGAATDVYSEEPIKKDNTLIHVKKSDKLLLYPHIAWASIESRNKLLHIIKDHILEFTK
ncbi:MAG: D-2-hydroxyacid dehydrogenase [Cyclobacteriaceae bacterium]